MTDIVISGAAAAFLILMASMLRGNDWLHRILFVILPMFVGIALAFVTVAKVMEWPL